MQQPEEPSPLRRLAIPTLIALAAVTINYRSVEAQILSHLVPVKKSEIPTYNSQTVPLLKSTSSQVNATPLALEEGAYVAETGPLGVSFDTVPGGTISRYTIREGDTIDTIAHAFGISKNTIVWANNIKKGTTLKPGEQLIILPISGVRYIVKEQGEKLSTIAAKYHSDAEEIAQYNDLDATVALQKGVELIIPDGELLVEPTKKIGEKPTLQKKTALASEIEGSHDDHNHEEVKTPGKLPTRVSVDKLKDPSGYFMMPLKSGTRTQKLHGFNGVDIGVPVGTPVYAAAGGTVILVKGGSAWNGGYGNYVVIEHSNGTQTLYAHNSKNSVKEGDVVKKGQQIALSGNTGRSTGPHLHFEIRNGKQVFAN